ncbi:MAG: serine acetyltransferase [Myxococcales bacterium]|jgi:serine O-acetyltransferase|nr:serine acetyltransferase [Myxococcales bacterium]
MSQSNRQNPIDTLTTNPVGTNAIDGANNVLGSVVDQLVTHHCCRVAKHGQIELPSKKIISNIIEDLRCGLFPGYFGVSDMTVDSMRFHVGATLDRAIIALEEQIRRGLHFTCTRENEETCLRCRLEASDLAHQFLLRLPEIKHYLDTDVAAVCQGDPAVTGPDEAIFCYPGILAITNYRIAHALHQLEVPLIPRIITELAHSLTGIDIHPGAAIGESFFIDHGTGVVVGETCIIGNHVTIYQGVTLGARSIPFDEDGNPIKGVRRHPIVEDNVVIYSGATVLGRITVGQGSIIGGNVWLTRSVPQGSRITQAQLRSEMFAHGAGI